MPDKVVTSASLREVRYEIRGQLAQRAHDMERQGYEIVSLNIGNPGLFGFRTPETIRMAMIENLPTSEGLLPSERHLSGPRGRGNAATESGVLDISAEEVFIGNGVSELIDLTLRGLLNPGDEVLVPSPDYPLWTAAVTLNGGRPLHYRCPPERAFEPDLEHLRSLISPRTRALVIINPNNPTGAVYSRETLEAMVALAEEHQLVLFSDEIYDGMTYDDAEFVPLAPLVKLDSSWHFQWSVKGLSRLRLSGRLGCLQWRFGAGGSYLHALDLLASLRLCSNVPGQWGVQTALGGYQSLAELRRPGGRLYESRRAVLEAVAASPFLTLVTPGGSMYGFVGVDTTEVPYFDDHDFALSLLETEHVLVAPGSSFNVDYRNYFRITLLPEAGVIEDVFHRIDRALRKYRENNRQ